MSAAKEGGYGGGGYGRDRDDDFQGKGARDSDPLSLRRRGGKRKVCRFCADTEVAIDYKDPSQLKYFVSERGKLVPRRITGNCALHQREITRAVKRARQLALMPYTSRG
ncbi:MAG: 30S ribosomal protein S18 [Polyangiales bacterium]